MRWVDLHCHLDLYPDPAAELEACRLAGVAVWGVTTLPESSRRMRDLAMSTVPGFQVGIGLHPELLHEHLDRVETLIDGVATSPLVGEVGLDGSPEYRPHQAKQLMVLDRTLQACTRLGGRWISMHSRRAASAVLDRLAAHPDAGVVVMHWFSGTRDELAQALMAGCWFSVGLPMLLSTGGRARVAAMPRNRVLTETDGPLARASGRVQRPIDVRRTVEVLANVWNLPTRDAETQVWSNYLTLMAAIAPPCTTPIEQAIGPRKGTV